LVHGAKISRDAARAIPRNLSGRAISVDQANLSIGGWVRIHPLHAICPHAIVPIAHKLRQSHRFESLLSVEIDQAKIIAAALAFTMESPWMEGSL